MTVTKTSRGFDVITHQSGSNECRYSTLVQASSSIRDDNLGIPGSSCLWIGDDHHLDRVQVAELVMYLRRWLATGRLVGTEDVP